MASKRITITLSEKCIAELEELEAKKQLSKSIIISLAIEKMLKEELKEKED